MNNLDGIMDSVWDKVRATLENRMNEYALSLQNFMNGPEADNATMSGKPNVAFALKTAKVIPEQSSDT